MELLLVTEGENKHYVLIKDFNKFMYNQTKHEHRKHFCLYCLQCFSSEDILRWPNTVFWYTVVSKRYLETTYFWVPEISMVKD